MKADDIKPSLGYRFTGTPKRFGDVILFSRKHGLPVDISLTSIYGGRLRPDTERKKFEKVYTTVYEIGIESGENRIPLDVKDEVDFGDVIGEILSARYLVEKSLNVEKHMKKFGVKNITINKKQPMEMRKVYEADKGREMSVEALRKLYSGIFLYRD